MKQSTFLLLVLGVLAGLVALTCAGVLLLLTGRWDPIPRTVGIVLTYEVVGMPGQQPAPADMQQLVTAIDRRVNPGGSRRAVVRDVVGRVQVGVYGEDVAVAERIDRILSAIGTLEFRILATTRKPEYAGFVERAKLLSEKETELKDEATGERLAFWVPVQGVNAQQRFAADPALATREVAKPEGKQFQVLVVDDPWDVTGAFLTRVRPGVDSRMQPAVEFSFNAAGAQRFGSLTGSHLPDPQGDFRYLLGIILDGEVQSAPSIMSTIFGSGIIEGDFTQQEVEDLADVLNAGPLPMAIKRVH